MSKNVTKLRKVAICGLLAAFVFVATQIRIPTAIGYINLGDPVILISSFILGPIAFSLLPSVLLFRIFWLVMRSILSPRSSLRD